MKQLLALALCALLALLPALARNPPSRTARTAFPSSPWAAWAERLPAIRMNRRLKILKNGTKPFLKRLMEATI